MIGNSVVRVHQHGACIADNNQQDMGLSRGGLTSKIYAVVPRPASRQVRRMAIGCVRLFSAPCFRKRCYSRIPDMMQTGSESLPAGTGRANIPPKRNRKDPICFSPYLYARAT